jgi:tetratricopeptide (TPR) repeat protein
MEELVRRYPGWPLWGLKLAEHLRDRLGAYAESAAVARRMLDTGDAARPEAGAAALALARLSLGESLLLDLRPEEARLTLLPLLDASTDLPALGARARLLIGRSLELEGEREGALAHYRAAVPDRDARKRAQAALAHLLSATEVEGRRQLALARRARESGRGQEAATHAQQALTAWPDAREATLIVAERELHEGGGERARVPQVDETREGEPPWLVPWSRLLRARQADARGEREIAVGLYKQVYAHACRRADLREAAADGLRSPFRPESPRATPSVPAPRKRTAIPTAPGAGFLDVSRFSTAASTG